MSDAESVDVLALVEQMTGADVATVNALPLQSAALSDQQLEHLNARATGGGGGCAIDAMLKDGLSRDDAAQAALSAIPSNDRSVSNAIQLWDGDWVSSPATPDQPDPLRAVRSLTIAVLEAAPVRCRNQPLRGPRFVIVPLRDGKTMVVVIGSGDWRWRDVLPEKPPRLLRWLGF